MEKRIVDILNAVNTRFYRENAESFSQTRQFPWEGWIDIGKRIVSRASQNGGKASILDIGCGNMRFENFLEENYPNIEFDFTCIDSCKQLVPKGYPHRFIESDVIAKIVEDKNALEVNGMKFDIAVAFGLMHHVPGQENRSELLSQICAGVKPGGYSAISFWQFAQIPKLKSKGEAATKQACSALNMAPEELEENDYFLGWSNSKDAFRYCHSFTGSEIHDLLHSVSSSMQMEALYSADTANCYAVLRRKH